jgi:hypothetical protein
MAIIDAADAPRLRFRSAAEADDALVQRYLDVLDIDELTDLARGETAGLLSGLFLPSASDAYLNSKVRIMLVGQEPKGWGTGLLTFASGERTPSSLDTYVRAQMAVHRKAAAKGRPGACKFLQFRKLLRISMADALMPGPSAVHWSNLLCVSLNKRSPRKASQLDAILSISKKLLDVQLDVLQPDLVVFGTGVGYDPFLRHQIGSYTTLAGLKPREFWPFEAETPGFLGWRVNHPRRLTKVNRRLLIGAMRAHASAWAEAG